jgi:N-acetylneuraminic acid mutarotase
MMKVYSILFIFLLIGSFLFVFSPISFAAVNSVGDSWTVKSSMSQARGGLGVVVVGDKIYAVGGRTVEGFVGTTEQYDPKTDTWTAVKSMPAPRAYFAVAAYQGKIYCIGGLNNDGPCSVNEVYDTATDSWSVGASLPVKGKNLQGQMVDGKIFAIEGSNLFMYDPKVDVWSKKAGLPANVLSGSNSAASAVVDNNIVVTSKSKVVIYDVNTDIWCEGRKPPSEISQGVSGATVGVCAPKRIYTIGTIIKQEKWWPGLSNQVSPGSVTSILPIVEVYDPVKNVWSNVNVGMNRVDFGVAVVDDVLYVIGGYIITFGETIVTVDVEESAATLTPYNPFATKIVSRQFVAQESVVGDPCSSNWQYVPIGYHVTSSGNVVSPSNQIPDESTGFGLSSNMLLITGLVLIIGIALAGVFIYFRKSRM